MSKIRDLTEQRFGRLVAIERLPERLSKDATYRWKCACDCGTVIEVQSSSLISGNTKSCGCLKKKELENPSKIKQLREKLGLTQSKLSKGLGIPLRTIADWERGARTPSVWVEKMVLDAMIQNCSKEMDSLASFFESVAIVRGLDKHKASAFAKEIESFFGPLEIPRKIILKTFKKGIDIVRNA